MLYQFVSYKNVYLLNNVITLKADDGSYYSIGLIENHENIEHALERYRITYNSVYEL